MISYSTNWMGPINRDWIAKNGDCWAAGRIDVLGGRRIPTRDRLASHARSRLEALFTVVRDL